MKDRLNLLHRHGVNEPRLSFSAISAVFENVEVSLHELLIIKQLNQDLRPQTQLKKT